MQTLKLKNGNEYWLYESEVEQLRNNLDHSKFVTINRIDKTINTYDIQEIGTPDHIRKMLKQGRKIKFTLSGMPVAYISSISEYRYLDGKWERVESISNSLQTFEEMLGSEEIKRLN